MLLHAVGEEYITCGTMWNAGTIFSVQWVTPVAGVEHFQEGPELRASPGTYHTAQTEITHRRPSLPRLEASCAKRSILRLDARSVGFPTYLWNGK